MPVPARARRRVRLSVRASRSTSTQAGRRTSASSSSTDSGSEGGGDVGLMQGAVLEGRGFAVEDQLHRAGLAVAVLGDDHLGEPLVRLVVVVVDLVAVDEGHHVGVLLDA